MRLRLFILFVSIFCFSFVMVQAQNAMVKRSTVVEQYKGKPYFMHFVRRGETLGAIAIAYKVTIDELIAENPSLQKGLKADEIIRIPKKSEIDTREPEIKPVEKLVRQPESPVNQETIIYIVKKKETLYGISKQFGLTMDEVLSTNPGFSALKEGMELKIRLKKEDAGPVIKEVPVEKPVKLEVPLDEIVVKQGETLFGIARANNVSVDDLIDLNPQLKEGLKAGMPLRLRKVKSSNTKTNQPETAINSDPEKSEVQNRAFSKDSCYNADNLKRTYQVALMLPFLLDKASDVLDDTEGKEAESFDNFDYFQFYAGFMLAADSLEQYGLNARIQVLDSDKLNDTLIIRQVLRKPGMEQMDLLVGPIYGTSFNVAARYAQKNKIGIVNPLSRRENIVLGNPFVFKAQVSSQAIAAKLAAMICNNFPGANIIAVRNDRREQAGLAGDFISRAKTLITDKSFAGTLQEVTYSTEFMGGVIKKFKLGIKNIVILFSNNNTVVPNFVSLLNPYAKANDVTLVGMDGWDELDLETEFLVNLNYHQVTSSYVDYESKAVQQFITRFQSKYGAIPQTSKHAFLGYDLGWFFLTSLMLYGDNYISCLHYQQGIGLQYNFGFSASKQGDGLQNSNVEIVKIQDYKMVKVE